uniref:C-type lectin domain-containing protein n=1 Tax=Romanomermis culicivorax TaxID=13658 RepID=A0A915KJG0_ROMCU
MVWKWSNSCPYNAHYPFWGAYPIPLGFETLVTRMTYRGVLWSHGFELRPVVCYKEFEQMNSSSCTPQEFQLPPETSTLLCNSTLTNSKSWWCVASHPEWSNLTSVSKYDSCFCLLVDSDRVGMDFNDAVRGCSTIGGQIAELNNAEEFGMIERLIEDLDNNGQDLMNACPFETTYVNRSCFILTSPTFRTFVEAENYCRETYTGGHLISLHSYYEHNAAYYTLVTKGKYVGALGVYTGLHRNSTDSIFRWSDASLVDYTPGWSVWAIPGQPQDDPNTYMLSYECPLSQKSFNVKDEYPFWVLLSKDLLRTNDCSSKTNSPLLKTFSSLKNSSSNVQHMSFIWERQKLLKQDQKTTNNVTKIKLKRLQLVVRLEQQEEKQRQQEQ